jgi:hypothetical protein
MGGSSKPNLGPAPAAPTPVDIGSVFSNADTYGNQFYGNQLNQLTSAYPQISNLQNSTISNITNQIAASPYTQQALGAAQAGIGQATNLGALGSQFQNYGTQALSNAGPTGAESTLLNQTASDLALGSSLNPEEERAASQQASNAFAMRGLGTGESAAAADILNRYQVGQARLQQRQSAFTNADNAVNQNVLARTSSALGALGQAGNAYGQSATVGYQGATNLNALNPTIQGLGYGTSLAGQNLGSTGALVGNAYNNALDTAGNVATFNTNMQSSLYNSYMNNQAALAGAQNAANASMWGAGIGAVGSVGGALGAAAIMA